MKYKHYKGGIYTWLGEAIHTETGEELVIYRAKESEALYARPKEMFFETLEYEGRQIPQVCILY